jgi:F-type H+-transporting ATPase subunit epsilon
MPERSTRLPGERKDDDMAGERVRLRIVTPINIKVDEDADMVIMRCVSGDLGVLPGHMPLSAALCYGALRIIYGDGERKIVVYGGFVTIQNDVVTVLTKEAEWPDEINLARAHADREHAEQRLREQIDDKELITDQMLLRRALVQIEIGTPPFDEIE